MKHAKDYALEVYDMLRSNQSCKVDGCNKYAQVGGYCKKHAKEYNPEAYNKLRSPCAIKGCEKGALKATGYKYCTTHAKEHDPDAYRQLTDKPICSRPGCTASVFSRGLCRRHRYPCTHNGCEKQALTPGGYCSVHAKEYDSDAHNKWLSQRKRCCKVESCCKQTQAGGYCLEHAKEYNPYAHRKLLNSLNKTKAYRRETDPQFKLSESIRGYIKEALKRVGKTDTGKVKKYLGCTVTQLRQYFEYNHFQEEGKEWMRWENWGGKRCHKNRSWEVDHIMPVSSFDLTDEEEVKKCFHWSNLQPLEWQDNMEKGDSIPKDFEWCNVNKRWMWGEASGKINYELPTKVDIIEMIEC